MIDHDKMCEQCGAKTMTVRIAIGAGLQDASVCRTCVEEALEELLEHCAPQHAEVGGES